MNHKRYSVKPNALAVNALKPGADKYEVAITSHPGLVLRVWPSGEKSYLLRYRLDGVLKRVRLGSSTLAEATAEWAKDRAALKRGEDAGESRKAARISVSDQRAQDRREPTVEALAARYLEEHVRPNLRSAPEIERILTKNLPSSVIRNKVKDITRAEIKALVAQIAVKGGLSGQPAPVMANRTLATLSSMFSFAVEAELISTNPCHGINRPGKEQERDRRLDPSEIKTLWKRTEDAAIPLAIRAALRFQILTGARASEVLEARWAEIKGDLWEIPAVRSKSAKARQVPLSPQALDVLASMTRGKGFIFEAMGAEGHVRLDTYVHAIKQMQIDAALAAAHIADKAPARIRAQLIEKAGKSAWRSHDLRRSAASGMSDLGAPREVIALVLGHSIPGVTSRYDRGERLAEKRRAVDAWGAMISEIIVGSPRTTKVVRMKQPRGAA
jgi:integrase